MRRCLSRVCPRRTHPCNESNHLAWCRVCVCWLCLCYGCVVDPNPQLVSDTRAARSPSLLSCALHVRLQRVVGRGFVTGLERRLHGQRGIDDEQPPHPHLHWPSVLSFVSGVGGSVAAAKAVECDQPGRCDVGHASPSFEYVSAFCSQLVVDRP